MHQFEEVFRSMTVMSKHLAQLVEHESQHAHTLQYFVILSCSSSSCLYVIEPGSSCAHLTTTCTSVAECMTLQTCPYYKVETLHITIHTQLGSSFSISSSRTDTRSHGVSGIMVHVFIHSGTNTTTVVPNIQLPDYLIIHT